MKLFAELFGVLLLMLLLLCPSAFAELKSFASEGKYQLGTLDSQKDAKSLALIDAKKQAIEEAVKYLAGLPEVKAAKLTGDQVTALASLLLSVEALSEERKQAGEISTITIKVRANLDTARVKNRIVKMREDDHADPITEMQSRMAALRKELADLKAEQRQSAMPQKEAQAKEQKETAGGNVQQAMTDSVSRQAPPAIPQKESALSEVVDVKKLISNEEKQKYENVMKNIFALDALEKGYIALADLRWNDAQYIFGRAIDLNPLLVDAYAGMSFALHNLKQSLQALTFVNMALKINAQSVRCLGIRALILKDQPGKIGQALAAINDAVKLKNDSPVLYGIRGDVYAKMGKATLARKDFAAACNMGAKESCKKVK